MQISSLPLPIIAVTGPATTPSQLVSLLQPQDLLIPAGAPAQAQVVSVKQDQQQFQLTLKITLDGGRQTTLVVISQQPLPAGTQLSVSQLSASQLTLTVQQALSGKTASLVNPPAPIDLPSQGKVPGLQPPLPLSASLNNIDRMPLPNVQTMGLAGIAARQDQLLVSQLLVAQQSRQGSLEGLLAPLQNLQNQQNLPLNTPLPTALRSAIDQLLAGLPDFTRLTSASGVAQAIQGSGVFLETQLLSGAKSADVPDLKGNLLRLIAQLTSAAPPSPSYNPAASLAPALPLLMRSALSILGQVSAKPSPTRFPLPSRQLPNASDEDSLQHLLRLASAAVLRLQSHQLSSLEQTGHTEDGTLQTTWQLEIPLRNLQDIVPLQVKVQREDPAQPDSSDKRSPSEAKTTIWRLELAFDLEPLGPLHIQAHLLHGHLSSQLWAERPATASLIDSQLGVLRERLNAAGLSVSDLNCQQGSPPQGNQTRLEQRWIDETA